MGRLAPPDCLGVAIDATAIYLSIQFPAAAPVIALTASEMNMAIDAYYQQKVAVGLDALSVFGDFIALAQSYNGTNLPPSPVPAYISIAFMGPALFSDVVSCSSAIF